MLRFGRNNFLAMSRWSVGSLIPPRYSRACRDFSAPLVGALDSILGACGIG